MLSAKNINNENVFLFPLQVSEIELLKSTNTFYCPCCNETVLIKNGKKKIAHFSHKKSSECPNVGESEDHILTKISIFESLKKNGIHAELEKYFNFTQNQKVLQRYQQIVTNNYSNLKINETFFGKLLSRNIFRPDIIFKHEGQNIAVEVQKSYLPREDFLLRTLFYNLFNIKVLWIIPRDTFLKKAFINNEGQLFTNISDFHKELRKYYFGNIYTWDYEISELIIYKTYGVEGYRTTGDSDSGYFQESGGYSFTYKKIKRLEVIYKQNNIVYNFGAKKILKNQKYNQLIDASIWTINIKK